MIYGDDDLISSLEQLTVATLETVIPKSYPIETTCSVSFTAPLLRISQIVNSTKANLPVAVVMSHLRSMTDRVAGILSSWFKDQLEMVAPTGRTAMALWYYDGRLIAAIREHVRSVSGGLT